MANAPAWMACSPPMAGQAFTPLSLASTAGASDQPHLVTRGDTLFAFWRTANEGFTVHPLP